MRMNWLVVIILFANFVGLQFSVHADYMFIRLEDTSTNQAFQAPVINDAGQVAYWARNSETKHTIDLWDKGSGISTNIVTANFQSTGSINESLSRPVINDFGQIAYLRTQSNLGVTNSLEVRSTVASQVYWTSTSNLSYNVARINESGRVAYSQTTTSVPNTTNVLTWDANGVSQNFGTGSTSPGINSSDAIAFVQGNAIMVGNSPSNLQSIPLSTFILTQPSISLNDQGKVAFIAADFAATNSGYNVYLAEVGSAPVVVAGAADFGSLSSTVVSINGHGELLFAASVGGVRGIYSTANGLNSPLIRVGDALDGSIVTGLSISSDAFNDFRDIGFVASLQDGRSGVYFGSISAVPEPSSGALFLLAASLFYLRRRKC